jgi:pilus assembly protein Flp/PilA
MTVEDRMGEPEQEAPKQERHGSMTMWQERLVRFLRAEDGPTAVEYAVMLALIIVVCLVAITALGTNANKVFANVALNVAAGS